MISESRIPLDEFNSRAAKFASIHRDADSTSFISNVDARVEMLEAGGALLPVTIHDGQRDNAWITSPLTAYRDYALEEIDRLGHRRAMAPVHGLTRAMGAWMEHAGLDRAVSVNNWLVSTNTYPDLPEARITEVVRQALQRWPDRPLWFRSLNHAHNAGWIRALRGAGCLLLPSRQVYLFDDIATLARQRSDVGKDFSLLRRSALRRYLADELDDVDYCRVVTLYEDLYIHKYSSLNPRYRAKAIKAWHLAGLLDLHGIRDADGMLQGIVGMLRFGDLITSPIVGYNTQLPMRLGLYRLLAASVLKQAQDEGCRVNLSAGVAHFKRQRGGLPAIEYSAVMAEQAPLRLRCALRALRGIAQTIGVPIMKHYRL